MRTQLTALIATVLFLTSTVHVAVADDHDNGYHWVPVSGTAIHYFTTAIIHSEDLTGNGKTQRSTDSIDLDGDLVGGVENRRHAAAGSKRRPGQAEGGETVAVGR